MDLSNLTNQLLDHEEMKFYLDHFGLKNTPTFERIKSWPKERLKQEEQLILSKSSNLSRKERDLVIYFSKK